jgi:hypothetical protein
VLDSLEEHHQALADETDLDLVGDTRPAAVWQIAGRCIGIARLIIDAVDTGYTAEVLHLTRALHESTRLAVALGNPAENDLLRRWLANEYVSPRDVRVAEQRNEEALDALIREAGGPAIPASEQLTREIHKQQSEAAHHQRRWTQDAVAPALRTMMRGPTSVWERRVGSARIVLMWVDEGIQGIGVALDQFHGDSWYESNVRPHFDAFKALSESHPLE